MTAFEIVQLALRIVLAALFAFMGAMHFVPTRARGMAAMIPPALKGPGMPSSKALVRFTGVCELAGAVGLLVPWTAFAAGIALVLFLVAVFPANAYAAAHRERFGAAAIPFWPRYIAQVALIALITVAFA